MHYCIAQTSSSFLIQKVDNRRYYIPLRVLCVSVVNLITVSPGHSAAALSVQTIQLNQLPIYGRDKV